MKQRVGPVARIVPRMRGLGERSGTPLLVLAALGLMVIGKSDLALVERARALVTDLTAPILEALVSPIVATANWIERADQVADAARIIERLQEDNRRLISWERAARALEHENAVLRQMLAFVPESQKGFVTARLIGDRGGSFVRSVLVNAGSAHGVKKGQVVLSSSALVGRVSEVGDRSARIVLVTDINSRIPVVVDRTRARAVLAGDNGSNPQLLYLPQEADVAAGDRILTSGHGGVFPPGLPIAEIIGRQPDGSVRVRLLEDEERLEVVRIVDFGLESSLDNRVQGRDGSAPVAGRTRVGDGALPAVGARP